MGAPGPAWLVAGLGNPGPDYRDTRHNIGFLVVERLAERWGAPPWRDVCRSRVAQARGAGREILLARPQTYMNRSGVALRALVERTDLPLDRVLVVHDDLDLPFGVLRIRSGGGPGGHNGVRSIVQEVGCGDFFRLKIGIDRPSGRGDAADYVLSPFSADEQAVLSALLDRAADAVESIIVEGPNRAMNRFHS